MCDQPAFDVTVRLITIVCPECCIRFAVPWELLETCAQRPGERNMFCPAGHQFVTLRRDQAQSLFSEGEPSHV